MIIWWMNRCYGKCKKEIWLEFRMKWSGIEVITENGKESMTKLKKKKLLSDAIMILFDKN